MSSWPSEFAVDRDLSLSISLSMTISRTVGTLLSGESISRHHCVLLGNYMFHFRNYNSGESYQVDIVYIYVMFYFFSVFFYDAKKIPRNAVCSRRDSDSRFQEEIAKR